MLHEHSIVWFSQPVQIKKKSKIVSNILFTCVHSIECVIHTNVAIVLLASFVWNFVSCRLQTHGAIGASEKKEHLHAVTLFNSITNTIPLQHRINRNWFFLLQFNTFDQCASSTLRANIPNIPLLRSSCMNSFVCALCRWWNGRYRITEMNLMYLYAMESLILCHKWMKFHR